MGGNGSSSVNWLELGAAALVNNYVCEALSSISELNHRASIERDIGVRFVETLSQLVTMRHFFGDQ